MSTSRLLSMLVAIGLVVAVVLISRAGIAAPASVSNEKDLSDYFQRHSGATMSLAGASRSEDYFLRHPATTVPADAPASDWFERHLESPKAGNVVDLSDYYQRHLSLQRPDNRTCVLCGGQ
jgi:hypothetical protein